MRFARFIAPAAGAIAVSALLSACAGGSPPAQPGLTAGAGVNSTDALDASLFPSDRWVYTAQLYGNDAKVYRRHGVSLNYQRSLMSGLASPEGMVATHSGWLYVANGGHSNVLVYRTGKNLPRRPSATLDDYGQIPDNVDVTENRNVVAVSNFSTTNGGSGSISVYLHRRAEPSRTLTHGTTAVQGAGVAIDGHGNCYWAVNDPSSREGSIVKFSGCTGHGRQVIRGIALAGGLTFDRDGNLFYIDQTDGVHRCSGVQHCKLLAGGFGNPVDLNFDGNERHLWIADASGYIDAIDPQSGKLLSSVPAQGGEAPYGVAPVPGD
jgi:DNA-binding beta-propeller fold protein YncE